VNGSANVNSPAEGPGVDFHQKDADAVRKFVRHRLRPYTADLKYPVRELHFDLVFLHAWKLGAYQDPVCGFVHVDRRLPRMTRVRAEIVAPRGLVDLRQDLVCQTFEVAAPMLDGYSHKPFAHDSARRCDAHCTPHSAVRSNRVLGKSSPEMTLASNGRPFYARTVVGPHSKITISTLRERKRQGRHTAMLTCYDFSTARIMEEAGLDMILVGDTYGEVCLGHGTTLPVTLEQLVTLAEAVRRGAPFAYLVGDMPYLTYQVSSEEAIRNAGQFMSRAGCDCVKVEVDRRLVKTVEAMSTATIPVMAHLGLLPQSIQRIGGYKAQGKQAEVAARIIEDARLMEEAGAVALLLEAVPAEVAKVITESTALPVIGCASGPYCDAQVVVLHDMLGYGGGHPPRSVKRYAQLHDQLLGAFREYVRDVNDGEFPALQHAITMSTGEHQELQRILDGRSRRRVASRDPADRLEPFQFPNAPKLDAPA